MNMDYFEIAHSLKSEGNVEKNSKSDKKIKRQLKQMLVGYKKNDYELIRNVENVKNDGDDDSISCLSEIEITNSSSDHESTKATLNSTDHDSVSSLIEDDDFDMSVETIEESAPFRTKYAKRKFNDEKLTDNSVSRFGYEQTNEGTKPKKNHSLRDSLRLTPYYDHAGCELISTPNSVSAAAEYINTEKLDDIIGQYKYATSKTTEQVNTTLSEFDDDLTDENVVINYFTPEINSDENISDVISSKLESSSPVQSEISEEFVDTEESPKVYRGHNCFIVVLPFPGILYIHGKVILTRLAGSVQMHGYNVLDESCEVYAPFYSLAYCLETVENNDNDYGLFRKLTTRGLSVGEAEEIVTSPYTNYAVVALEKLENIKITFVENYFNTQNSFNLFSKIIENIDSNFRSAAEILGCSFYSSRPYKHLKTNAAWEQTVRIGLNKKSKGIVCGGKGAGKSTFLRYYINRMLSDGPVLLIDLDPGQCEHTVAGNISATMISEPLLGPNYTHLRSPMMSYNIGMINVMDNINRYLHAVDTLLHQCSINDTTKNVRWVVNTMGMCNAIGLQLITYIILRTRPTFLMQIDLPANKKNFECYLTPQKVEKLYEDYKNKMFFDNLQPEELNYAYISSQAQTYRVNKDAGNDNCTLGPKDERYLNFLAYFGQLAQLHRTMNLLSIKPYSVKLESIYIATNIEVDKEFITEILNGKVVALGRVTSHRRIEEKVFKPRFDCILECKGHGIVRGIDKDVLYVITPISPMDLAKIDTIVYSDWVPELRGLEKDLPNGTVIPYRMHSKYRHRELMFVPRRRFNPLQLLRMKRKS